MHALQLKLNFMKLFAENRRTRWAKVNVTLSAGSSGNEPYIRAIEPEAVRVEVSEREVTTGLR